MKKSAIISALFTMMLVLTSFSTPTEIGGGKNSNGGLEFEQVKVYCVEFYPYTKYEVDIQKEALIELTNINLEDEN
jgi:hypothetical protein